MNITETDIIWLNRVLGDFHCWLFMAVTVLTIYFFYRLIGVKRVHANFRIVLCCAAGSFLVFSGTRLLIHFLLDCTAQLEDRYVINIACTLLSTLHTVSAMSSALCMNCLAIEQHLATTWVNEYENKSTRVGMILLLIVALQSVPTGCFINWWYLGKEYDFRTSKESCIPIELHWELAMLCYCACFISCMICSVWLVCLHRYNAVRTKNRLNMKSLSARFQQTENENSNKSIAPSLIGYMVLGLVGLFLSEMRRRLVLIYGEYGAWPKLTTQIGYMAVDFYALHHMFCFMCFNNAMRSLVVRDIGRLFGASVTANCRHNSIQPEKSGAETETYFKQFDAAWS
ncbi:unnamed protein product [Bursaphelenchus xylophilus]|uniref:(pine wood nematode) hypothetical protein n=1 Tax=Bursaphelenchus xylophilus TaxID=6326 RepID=A0A1I7SCG6_BURXY|nr:unnamed protein product [Bursaphelenchus xylophilus]CAG9094131.1 unnamed protein product [Bursaphelenchus xylophilus]